MKDFSLTFYEICFKDRFQWREALARLAAEYRTSLLHFARTASALKYTYTSHEFRFRKETFLLLRSLPEAIAFVVIARYWKGIVCKFYATRFLLSCRLIKNFTPFEGTSANNFQKAAVLLLRERQKFLSIYRSFCSITFLVSFESSLEWFLSLSTKNDLTSLIVRNLVNKFQQNYRHSSLNASSCLFSFSKKKKTRRKFFFLIFHRSTNETVNVKFLSYVIWRKKRNAIIFCQILVVGRAI